MSCVLSPENCKKQLKSSKMRRVRGVKDPNDMLVIRFGYQTVEKNRYYRYTFNRYASLLIYIFHYIVREQMQFTETKASSELESQVKSNSFYLYRVAQSDI